jgi:ADP-ribose pyrophosphatase YjhB (NUDIX family)
MTVSPQPLRRETRYQAAIMQGSQILLIRHQDHANGRTYWLLPGGGQESGESEEECVRREMREETNLEVHVERLLCHHPAHETGKYYKFYKTYLCRAISGEAKPGYEPEPEAAALYGIVEVRWFDLWDESGWPDLIRADYITYTNIQRVREALA